MFGGVPLAHLPIHAAGIYASDKSHAGPCVSDFVVSSYTPTVSTLIERTKHLSNETPTRLLPASYTGPFLHPGYKDRNTCIKGNDEEEQCYISLD